MEHFGGAADIPRTKRLHFEERVLTFLTGTKVGQVRTGAPREFQIDLMSIYGSEEPAMKRSVKLCSQKIRQV